MTKSNDTPEPTKRHNKLVKFITGERSKTKPGILLVVMVAFAAVGIWTLFGAHAASNDSMSLVPSSSSLSLGANVTVTIHENSSTDAVNAVEADLSYDQTKLQFVSIDTSGSAFDLAATATGGSGSVKIARAKSAATLTGDQVVATVTFTTIGTGSTSVTFANSSALVLASNATNVLAVTNPGTYTIADTTAPNVPTGLTAGTRTVNSIAFSWTAPTDNVGVTGYKVFRNGGGSPIATINTNTPSYTDTGLTAGTNYSYTVEAFDAAGNPSVQSASLATSTLPDTTAPNVPTGLTAGTRTVNSIAFSWTAPTDNVGVTGYKVFRNGGGSPITTINTNTPSYTDTGLTAGTNYSYTVEAFDAAGNPSVQSASLATSTLADIAAPTVPTGLTSPSQTTNSISLSWTASTDNVGVVGYNILRNNVKVGTSATTTYTDTGLTQGTSYTYTISAYDAVPNTSAVSTSSSFATTSKVGDVNGDGSVNILDLSVMATHFGQSGQTLSTGDLNGDGTVNILDLSILASHWGS